MKKAAPFILWMCFALAAGAQDKGITLNMKGKTIAEVFRVINTQYGYAFTYSSDKINSDREVSIVVSNATLDHVLKKLFGTGKVRWVVNGTQVLLYPDPEQKFTLSGYVREQGSGELLIGVAVGTNPVKAGGITNGYGFYSITVPADTFDIVFTYLGYARVVVDKLVLHENRQMDINLENAARFNEILVKADLPVVQKNLNSFEIPTKKISEVPMLLGEKDVIRYMMLMPGIQKGNEGSNYLYVRGGGMDQNLVLMDDAVIYNAHHLFGISSLFSGSELRRAEIIKGGFSAKYGGRLSSVVDLSLKDGNRERLEAEANMGVITSRLQVEGPIEKNKSSFFISARKSYISQMSKLLAKTRDDEFNYNYYDLHAKLSFELNPGNRLMLSGFMGNDFLGNGPDSKSTTDGMGWKNRALTIRLSHQYSSKLFSNTSLVSSYYSSKLGMSTTDPQSTSQSEVGSSILDYTLKHDIDYLLPGYNRMRFGVGSTRHTYTPRAYIRYSDPSGEYLQDKSTAYNAWENFVYGEFTWQPVKKWRTVMGLRASNFITGKQVYVRGEPRFNTEYDFGRDWFANMSYSLMNQYVHLVSSSGFGIPTDYWMPAVGQIMPQRANLVSFGLTKNNLYQLPLTFSVEVYYKFIDHMVGLRDGTSMFSVLPLPGKTTLISDWNELLTQGNCTSYGTELMMKKNGKYFTGWISYTLSKTTLQFNGVNRGNPFPATYDRRNDLGIFLSWFSGNHFRFSTTWIYGSGNAVSLPVGVYYPEKHTIYPGSSFVLPVYDYDKKNAYRMRDYHRLDVSMQYNSVLHGRWISTVELSVFNVYNRANPFYYDLANSGDPNNQGNMVIKQTSIFPIIPSLSWTVKF